MTDQPDVLQPPVLLRQHRNAIAAWHRQMVTDGECVASIEGHTCCIAYLAQTDAQKTAMVTYRAHLAAAYENTQADDRAAEASE